MQRFYIPLRQGNTFIMDATESHHCIRVLRMGVGDSLHFTDGRGGAYSGVISTADPKTTLVEVTHASIPENERPYKLHIAIAPTKNSDRFEWFVEKAVEIGVDEITPLICEHSERKNLRTDRLEKIAVSAMKQSLKVFLPAINPCSSFKNFVSRKFDDAALFVAYCGTDVPGYLLTAPVNTVNILVMIGPEGDFSREEIILAENNGFKTISFGPSRLRTETAGVVCAQIMADRSLLENESHLKNRSGS
jgi:16S rRNA (uracil1498-N3)-methyltransferase